MTETHLRRPMWIAFISLMVMTALVASNSRVQGGVTDVRKDITVDFAILPSGVSVPPSFQIAGMTFFAHSSPDFYADPFHPYIADWGPPHEGGYVFPNEGVTVVLPLEAWAVEVRLCNFSDALVEAYSSTGILITQERGQFFYVCHDVLLHRALDSDLISVVRFTGGYNEASILRLRAILSTSPVVDAGEDQFVATGKSVRLSGTALDPHTGITRGALQSNCPTMVGHPCSDPFASFTWEQTGGTEVLLGVESNFFEADFTAPEVSAEETLTFRLTVTNYDGERGSDDVKVVVLADE